MRDMISRQAAVDAITSYNGVVDKSVAKRILIQLPSVLQAQDSKICKTCKHNPPSKKWPCIDCDMREPADRWERRTDETRRSN